MEDLALLEQSVLNFALKKSIEEMKKSALDFNQSVDDHEKILESVSKDNLSIDLLNVIFDPTDASIKDMTGSFVSAFVGDGTGPADHQTVP